MRHDAHPVTTAFDLGYFAVGSLLFGRSLIACAAMRRVPFLPDAAPPIEGVSVIVPVRRAGPSLERCLRDLSTQRGCVVEVIVVDDRSAEPDTIAAVCAGREGVRLVRVDSLDSDWLPWSNAWRRGLDAAAESSSWVLLAETPIGLLHDDALARAIAGARAGRAAAMWLVPRTPSGLLTPSMLTALTDALPAMAATNQDRESVGWPGLPCLGRRDTMRAALRDPRAGMAAVFERILLDHLRRGGQRGRHAFAADEFEAPPARLQSTLENVERLLAMLGFRGLMFAVALLLYGALWGIAVRGAFDPNLWGLWAFGGLVSLAVPCALAAGIQRTNRLAALIAPLVFPLEAALTLWAIWRARRRGGVEWRGTFVGLDRLRVAATEP